MISIKSKKFGEVEDRMVWIFTLSNGNMEVLVSDFGCTIIEINVPDRNGIKKNIVAGYKTLDEYVRDEIYAGSVVGRYANRIAFGRFSLDGIEYSLPVNNGHNHLHGGIRGFNKKIWNVDKIEEGDESAGIVFSYVSPDGEESYPGNLNVSISYKLDKENNLSIKYEATTDKATIINLTNHSYFNLSGFEHSTILEHELKVNANKYTVKNENNIPSGKLETVSNSPFDFTNGKKIGARIRELKEDRGYDHNFVLENNGQVKEAVVLTSKASGRVLKVFTDRPGIQVYTANWWDGSIVGRQGRTYEEHGAVALETQLYPDSPNHPEFPTVILRPGQQYLSETIYQFIVDEN